MGKLLCKTAACFDRTLADFAAQCRAQPRSTSAASVNTIDFSTPFATALASEKIIGASAVLQEGASIMNGARNRTFLFVLGIMLLIGILPCSLVADPLDQDPPTQSPQANSGVNQSNAAPGKPTLVSPVGRVLGSTIAFTWRHVPGATFYYLWVEAKWIPGGADRVQSWYTAEQAGCSAPGSLTCSVTVTAHWDVGDGKWWILAWNSDGYGPWSDPMSFTLNQIQNFCGSEDVTYLLFPFVSNKSGFETGIAIMNTGLDPLGTTGKTGTCTAYYYGSPSVAAQTSSSVPPGQHLSFTLTSGIPGSNKPVLSFQGYMIIKCNFPYAHGFAFFSDRNTPSVGSSSYLAQVLCSKRMPVEQLLQ
jgi:hypothetical protein